MDFRSGEGMMAFGEDLRVLAWNDAAVELTGIAPEDAVGRCCWEVLRAVDDRDAMVCHAGCSYARLAREGWSVPTRKLWIRTLGGTRRVSVATVAVKGGEAPVYLHLLRNGEEMPAERAPESASSVTGRQLEVLHYLGDGVPAKVIARTLRLSETTIRNHIRAVLTNLGCHSQLEAVAKARRAGIL
jgi:PAS domain S-box-containing protein